MHGNLPSAQILTFCDKNILTAKKRARKPPRGLSFSFFYRRKPQVGHRPFFKTASDPALSRIGHGLLFTAPLTFFMDKAFLLLYNNESA